MLFCLPIVWFTYCLPPNLFEFVGDNEISLMEFSAVMGQVSMELAQAAALEPKFKAMFIKADSNRMAPEGLNGTEMASIITAMDTDSEFYLTVHNTQVNRRSSEISNCLQLIYK